jgi:hypothetical protein
LITCLPKVFGLGDFRDVKYYHTRPVGTREVLMPKMIEKPLPRWNKNFIEVYHLGHGLSHETKYLIEGIRDAMLF